MVVAWGATPVGGNTDIYTAVSRDAAATFAAPVRVNDVAGDARVNGEQPPRIALADQPGRDPSIVIVWTSRRPRGTAILTARSVDGGKTFSRARPAPGGEAAGNRGWESVTVMPNGRVIAAWLDHREMVAPPAPVSSSNAHAAHGSMSAEKSQLYVAALDGQPAGRALAGGVCYCCKTATAIGPDGAIHVAWRHVYPGDYRDIALASSRDGARSFSQPVRINEDGWSVTGCPENGPAIVVDRQNVIHVAWATMVQGAQPTLGLFYTSSKDGRTFTSRRRVSATGTPSHVQMALDNTDQPVLVWDEIANGARQVMMSRGAGSSFSEPAIVSAQSGGTYPSIATTADGLVVTWTTGPSDASRIRVEKLARLPR